MTPYYESGGITIYHGDAREIMPTLPKVDLVLTDPPYGMSYHSGRYIGPNPHKPIVGDDAYPLWAVDMCRSIATVAVLFFMRWDNLADVPKPDSVLAWVKNGFTAGDLTHDYARAWEAVAVWNGPNHAFRDGRPSDVIFADRVSWQSLLHPTQKPVPLIARLMSQHVGEVILDPFMGSGTTLWAAKDLGRKAIGIEIKERYCEIAANRMGQEVFEFPPRMG